MSMSFSQTRSAGSPFFIETSSSLVSLNQALILLLEYIWHRLRSVLYVSVIVYARGRSVLICNFQTRFCLNGMDFIAAVIYPDDSNLIVYTFDYVTVLVKRRNDFRKCLIGDKFHLDITNLR
ncbi:uncharacterized protein LOC111253075 [Varroa destructor]|uniref:Uncharacterized protein n=1 Tax=Varroa destructor TaxID=109461 RepID=A0A7M7KLU7_VARDE|nr:uncharacterized protein LOC111253075 [Varroa destructor]